jgi:nucleotide-binding universal stress UspA family protein
MIREEGDTPMTSQQSPAPETASPPAFTRLIAAIAGPAEAETAIAWVAALAPRLGLPVTLATVLDPAGRRESPVVAAALARDLHALLAADDRLRGLTVSTRVVVGLREEELPRLAPALSGALLVIVGGEHGGPARSLFGESLDTVLHALRTPVVVLPPRDGMSSAPGGVTIGVDEGAPAVEATGRALAAALGVPAVAVRVVEPGSLPPPAFLAVEPVLSAEEIVVRGHAAETLLAAARVRRAGLIVVGAHGAGGFARRSLGGTASWLAHHADRPVLIVPARDRP